MDFLWRKISEKEREDIRKQAKQIMDNFSRKLEKVKSEIKDSESNAPILGREEKNAKSLDMDRDIMFENAPNKNNSSIVAEKGEW